VAHFRRWAALKRARQLSEEKETRDGPFIQQLFCHNLTQSCRPAEPSGCSAASGRSGIDGQCTARSMVNRSRSNCPGARLWFGNDLGSHGHSLRYQSIRESVRITHLR
jgi:hypothetical protein